MRKPYRVAFVVGEVALEGADQAFRAEAALVAWALAIDVAARHPELAVSDLAPVATVDGHLAALGQPVEGSRRDDLLQVELASANAPARLTLHATGRDRARRSFAGRGGSLGQQLGDALNSWLASIHRAPLTHHAEVTFDELVAASRMVRSLVGEPKLPSRVPAGLQAAVGRLLGRARATEYGPVIGGAPAGGSPAIGGAAGGSPVIEKAPAGGSPMIGGGPAGSGPAVAGAPPKGSPLIGNAAAGESPTIGELAFVREPADPIALAARCAYLSDSGRYDEALRLATRDRRFGQPPAPLAKAMVLIELQLLATSAPLQSWLGRVRDARWSHSWTVRERHELALRHAEALAHDGRRSEAIEECREFDPAGRSTGSELIHWFTARAAYLSGDLAPVASELGPLVLGESSAMIPAPATTLAMWIEALVATGHEHEVALAWGRCGLANHTVAPGARLAAARGLLIAGEWRRGLEELLRVELAAPSFDRQVAIAHCGRLLAAMPIDVTEAMLAEWMSAGATTLARRMARTIGDFAPGAAASSIVMRALGKGAAVEPDIAPLAQLATRVANRDAIDALFGDPPTDNAPPPRRRTVRPTRGVERATSTIDLQGHADRLVSSWSEVAMRATSDTSEYARAALYVASHAIARYLAATTAPPTVMAGALRTVAVEALAIVAEHGELLTDDDIRGLLAVVEPVLRRVDRWVAASWLAVIERACAIDERADGDVAGFASELATIAARIVGPEEVAVLEHALGRGERSGSLAAHAAQGERLAFHIGAAAAPMWAEVLAGAAEARAIEVDDAIDGLHTAAYLADGVSAVPAMRAAQLFASAGRPAAAIAVLANGLPAANAEQRAAALAMIAKQPSAYSDPAVDRDHATRLATEALARGDIARAERLARWAVALDPANPAAHRALGLACAHQLKLSDAVSHLSSSGDLEVVSSALYQRGKVAEAMAVLDFAARGYREAAQWLAYAKRAFAAMDNVRAIRGYAAAHRIDPSALDIGELNAYAGALAESGNADQCERVANELLERVGDDPIGQASAWHHLACAMIGQGKFDQAIELAERALARDPQPDSAAAFSATLDRARARVTPTRNSITNMPEIERTGSAVDTPITLTALAQGTVHQRRLALANGPRFGVDYCRAVSAVVLAQPATDHATAVCRVLALELRAALRPARRVAPAQPKGFSAGPPAAVDRVVVPGAKVSRVSDYVALLRDLAALTPREALAQFDLDDASYRELATQWATAIANDRELAAAIEASLSRATV